MTMCVRNSSKVILIIEFRQLGVKTGHFLTTRCSQKVLRDFFFFFFFKSGCCFVFVCVCACVVLFLFVFWFVCVVFLFVCMCVFYTDSGDNATLQRFFFFFFFFFCGLSSR